MDNWLIILMLAFVAVITINTDNAEDICNMYGEEYKTPVKYNADIDICTFNYKDKWVTQPVFENILALELSK